MSRLKIETPDQAQLTVERLYKDLERHIIASPPGLCPVDMQLSFLKVCHAQTCGKCAPCRVGLAQLQKLLENILDGKATMKTLELIESTAQNIMDSADCAIGYEAAHMVLAGLEGFRENYIHHIKTGKCHSRLDASIPCVALCPAQVDIPGYIALVGEGRYADAVKLIRKDNPFPTACALICEHPCEARCRRSMIDAPINIRGLKRMAVDNAPANTVPVPEKAETTGKRIAIIGGGPSGLAAAYYLELMGHHAVVFEAKSKLGGMLRYGIPSYRFPRERLDQDIEAILSTGVEVHLNTKVGNGEGEVPFEKLREEFDAVYIAIGAHEDKKVGIEGEDSKGVISAVEMLRSIGEDIMPDFKDKNVVVIGGGNVAMDCTRSAVRLGAKKVTIAYRRRKDDMTALPEEIEGAIAEGAELYELKAPHKIEADENGNVTALWAEPQIIGPIDAWGRARPIRAELPLDRIPCDVIV
ncbi:MAG: FAD-dependent oxidoreductase, partial [Phascolarctobacterium sp.]|nr:FAD-dependent oxidoreductase [Phascolarctobacterium sp.]